MRETNVEIHINPVYVPYLHCNKRTQIFYGGASSGKSKFLAQRCILDLLEGKRNYLVVRQVARTMKTSVFQELERVITELELLRLFGINRTDRTIICKTTGCQLVCVGLDDTEKIKSIVPERGAWTDVWVEEATETERRAVKQLFLRQRGGDESVPKRLTMSFNPILQSHWIYEDYFSDIGWTDTQQEYTDDGLMILKTVYGDNQYLTPDDIALLEGETDGYYRDVYTLGKWGVLGNVIFTNWQVQDLSEQRDQFTNRRNGLDFGFSSDPAALSRSHYDRKHKTIYIFDELYEKGLTNDILASRILPMLEMDFVVCDSAEPKSIAELQSHGVNAGGAAKGKDSVLHGIQWLQQQTIVIDKSCINAQNEFRQYHWKQDKNGVALPQPIERDDHIIDATRYAYERDMVDLPLIFFEV